MFIPALGVGTMADKWEHLYHGYIIRKHFTQVLGLKGTQLLVYAIISSFTENNDNKGAFAGSLEYLADMTGASRSSVLRALKALEEKQYILTSKRKANYGDRLLIYRANMELVERMTKEYVNEVYRLSRQGARLSCADFDDEVRPEPIYAPPTKIIPAYK